MSQQRKSLRLESKPVKTWKRNGAWGTKETNSTVSVSQTPSTKKKQNNPAAAKQKLEKEMEKTLIFNHKEYDVSEKLLPASQTLLNISHSPETQDEIPLPSTDNANVHHSKAYTQEA